MTENVPNRVRFGPFRADLRTRELWKEGIRLKLAGQPFQVLEILLNNRDRAVAMTTADWTSPNHAHVRGPGYYQ